MRKKNTENRSARIIEHNAKVSKKMDANCNVLGYLVSSDEMSRFTPNLYDDIFIFDSKRKDEAIAERTKFKQADQFVEDVAPEIAEEEVAQVVTPIQNVVEEPVEEISPEVIEEEPVVEVEDVVEDKPEIAEGVVFVDEQPVKQDETYESGEKVDKAIDFAVIPVVKPQVEEKELVTELEPIPVVVLEPIPVVTLEPVQIVEVEPILVQEEQPEVAEQIVEEYIEEPIIVEDVEEQPVIAEGIVEEPAQVEYVEEPVIVEEVAEEPEIAEEVVEYIEEPAIPFMAIMIPSSTEEDAELLKERYKTVPLEKRFERAPEAVREYYSELKNELLSYENVKSRMSKKFDTFSIGRFTVAKLTVKNDVVKLYLALANDTIDTKYYTEDVSNSEIYDQTPTLHNVKSKRGLKYGIELIREIMASIGYQKVEDYVQVDFAAEFSPVAVSVKKQFIADLMAPTMSVGACNVIANDLAYDMIDIVKSEDYTINKFYPVNKFRIYTDDLTHWFEDGEKVTIAALQEKGALPKLENLFLEVHGRGVLDRRLFVEAHSYDMKAVKMILLTDGEVIQYK